MMAILVKSDDVRGERKAKVRHGRHRRRWVDKILKKKCQPQILVKRFASKVVRI